MDILEEMNAPDEGFVGMNFEPAEYAEIEKAAAAQGQTVADYARAVIRAAVVRESLAQKAQAAMAARSGSNHPDATGSNANVR